jgi:hypothetical protein
MPAPRADDLLAERVSGLRLKGRCRPVGSKPISALINAGRKGRWGSDRKVDADREVDAGRNGR